MRVLVTGLNGTLAPVLAGVLTERGDEVLGWDRAAVPPDDETAALGYLDSATPGAICHLGLGSESWAGLLAQWSRDRGAPFLFTSTAMVFDHSPDGPHHVDDLRTARDDYGRYKIRCEDLIAEASKEAIIARIGWQIGTRRGGNNMLEALHEMASDDGVIDASRRWVPACSFMEDTAVALAGLLDTRRAGVCHLDSNADDALDFPTIVQSLSRRHGAGWLVRETDDYHHDQRLIDEREAMPSLAGRLGLKPES